MTTPLKILLSSGSMPLTAELDGEQPPLLRYQGALLSEHGHALEIRVPDRAVLPVTVEILDFETRAGRWTMTATHGSVTWERALDRCRFAWGETDGEVRVDVTASRDAEAKTRPIFIKVQPEGAKPWP